VGACYTLKPVKEPQETTTMSADPLSIPRGELEDLMTQITLADSPVGIDARYTHAVIITYLQQISERLDRLEATVRQ